MYWKGNKNYLAFGMGASSYIDNQRETRPKTLKKYMDWVGKGMNDGELERYEDTEIHKTMLMC